VKYELKMKNFKLKNRNLEKPLETAEKCDGEIWHRAKAPVLMGAARISTLEESSRWVCNAFSLSVNHQLLLAGHGLPTDSRRYSRLATCATRQARRLPYFMSGRSNVGRGLGVGWAKRLARIEFKQRERCDPSAFGVNRALDTTGIVQKCRATADSEVGDPWERNRLRTRFPWNIGFCGQATVCRLTVGDTAGWQPALRGDAKHEGHLFFITCFAQGN
jgi:hypothetical protein